MLFTDGSVCTRTGLGFGSYLLLLESELKLSVPVLKKRILVKRFSDTSSTKLELQTLLWALSEIPITKDKLLVYTDSQNIVGLPSRRVRLEQNDYRSKKNIRLKNYELYQDFYRITDLYNLEFMKVKGHKASKEKDSLDRVFTLVDRVSRDSLRESLRA